MHNSLKASFWKLVSTSIIIPFFFKRHFPLAVKVVTLQINYQGNFVFINHSSSTCDVKDNISLRNNYCNKMRLIHISIQHRKLAVWKCQTYETWCFERAFVWSHNNPPQRLTWHRSVTRVKRIILKHTESKDNFLGKLQLKHLNIWNILNVESLE